MGSLYWDWELVANQWPTNAVDDGVPVSGLVADAPAVPNVTIVAIKATHPPTIEAAVAVLAGSIVPVATYGAKDSIV
jgi:hypothetical protein